LVPHDDVLEISHLTTHLAGVAISARGTLDLSRFASADETPAIELLARSYSEICRRLPALTRPLAGLRDGRIDLTLRPSEKFGAIARVMLTGQGYQPTGAAPFTVGPFRASTRVPLRTTEPFFVRIAAATDRLQLPEGVTVDRPRTTLRARIAWDGIASTPQRAEIEPALAFNVVVATRAVPLDEGGRGGGQRRPGDGRAQERGQQSLHRASHPANSSPRSVPVEEAKRSAGMPMRCSMET
ncbi:MAG: hypothetical protein ACO3G4_09550, partial [Opitutaceae bacterium]